MLAALGAALASGCTQSTTPFAAAEMTAAENVAAAWPGNTPGCDAERAPAAPPAYEPAATARVLNWVYRDEPVEAYCGCAFGADGRVDPASCGYAHPADPAPVIRWEPIVPPSRFGAYRDCWQRWALESGSLAPKPDNSLARRKCAEGDEEFRAMEADLYNFLPALAKLAEVRGEHPFGHVQGEPRDFGDCDFESQSVMGKSARIEPPPDVRGDIARTYFYMAAYHGKGKDWKIKLSREQRTLLEKWSAADPVDDRERRRACRIQSVQGWANPYVK